MSIITRSGSPLRQDAVVTDNKDPEGYLGSVQQNNISNVVKHPEATLESLTSGPGSAADQANIAVEAKGMLDLEASLLKKSLQDSLLTEEAKRINKMEDDQSMVDLHL